MDTIIAVLYVILLASIGWLDHEHTERQRIRVDAELRLQPLPLPDDDEVLVVEGVVVEEAAVGHDDGALAAQGLLEAFGRCDAGEGRHALALQRVQRPGRARFELDEFAGGMGAGNDFGVSEQVRVGRRAALANQGRRMRTPRGGCA